jgi:hypothetical protein
VDGRGTAASYSDYDEEVEGPRLFQSPIGNHQSAIL